MATHTRTPIKTPTKTHTKRPRDHASPTYSRLYDEPEEKIGKIDYSADNDMTPFKPIVGLKLNMHMQKYKDDYDDGYETDETVPYQITEEDIAWEKEANRRAYAEFLERTNAKLNVPSDYQTSDTEPDGDNYRPNGGNKKSKKAKKTNKTKKSKTKTTKISKKKRMTRRK